VGGFPDNGEGFVEKVGGGTAVFDFGADLGGAGLEGLVGLGR
jgi:hypothetical protein